MIIAATSQPVVPMPAALMMAPAVILILVAWLGRRYLVRHRAVVGVVALLAVAATVPPLTIGAAGVGAVVLRGTLAVDGLLVFAASTAVRDAWRHTRDRHHPEEPPEGH